MSEPASTRGVFLSYAREDSGAAKRIADALAGFGIEVWFDQSELRGGDSWDATIKRQIRECALFVAIISTNSQARGEGYFRREWKLAVERTHDMASGIPFLIPVVIDQTPESKALVPEEFMRVQWTRLVDGAPTAKFVERVKRLAEDPSAQHEEPKVAGAPPRDWHTGAHRMPGMPGWAWGLIAGAAIAAAAFVAVSRKPPPVADTLAPARAAAEAPAPRVDDKSIAVLPFANMSDDKENAFFTDGIQEDILTNLALVHELRVVSRTSVEQYRDTKKPIRQIAGELGVAYILEGSVRRAGNKVRVTGQLIHAATDEHVWAKAFDRDLTDIFAIQSELSQSIAGELKAAISPEEKAALDRKPTENTEAYDLYLKARRGALTLDDDTVISLLEKAVELDPSFARAWGDLADDYAQVAFNFRAGVDERLAKAKAAIDRAVQLAPDDPNVIGSLGTYYYYAFRDYARATEQYQKLALQRPNDAVVYNALGLLQRRQGKWPESLENTRKAVELDVANGKYLQILATTLLEARRYDEYASIRRRLAALDPDNLIFAYYAVHASFYATGSTHEVDDFIAHLTPEQANSPRGVEVRGDWALEKGDVQEAIRLQRLQPHRPETELEPWEEDISNADNLFMYGDQAGALALLGNHPVELQKRLEKEPNNPRLWLVQSWVEQVRGHRDLALQAAKRSAEIVPMSLDALSAPVYRAIAARCYDYLGDKDRALAEITQLLRTPGATTFINVHSLRHDPFSTLHGDPRFEALLNDPANNAPLF